MSTSTLLFQLATALFAVTGVLAAARQNMDVLSFIIIGVVTAIGGGTLRDVMLNVPVFWIGDSTFLFVASAAAVATFFFERVFRATFNALLYLDAFATAVITILATEKTLHLGFGAPVAVVMGLITGIGGGVIRDLLTGQSTILMRRELYMTPLLIGGALFAFGRTHAFLNTTTWMMIAMAVIAILRFGAIRWRWGFPAWLTYQPTLGTGPR